MKNITYARRVGLLLGVGILGLALAPAPASAATLNFDDISGCQNVFGTSDPTYQGFNWSASWATECDANYKDLSDPNTQNHYGAPSPANAATNGFGEFGVTMSRAAAFDFLGGDVSTWAYQDAMNGGSSASIEIDGYDSSFNQLGSLFQLLGPSYSALDMNNVIGTLDGVNLLIFYSSSDVDRVGWLIDNVQVQDTVQPVPEPASLLLLGAGLGMVAVRMRKQARGRNNTQLTGNDDDKQ